jgi:hypothetical protein
MKQAFAGWPQLEPYDLDIRYLKDETLAAYMKFNACYAARHFLTAITKGNTGWKLRDENTIILDNRLIVRSTRAAEIYKYRFTDEEALWTLPTPYPSYAASIGGYSITKEERIASDVPPEDSEAGRSIKMEKKKPEVVDVGGHKDNPDWPWAQRVRRMAKHLSMTAHGTIDKWRDYKAKAEKELKK